VNSCGELFHYGAYIAQAATPLRIPYFTSALPRFDTGFDCLDNRTAAYSQQFGANGGRAVAEAVANRHIVVSQFFLMHRDPDLVFRENLYSIGGEVDYGAVGSTAKKIGHPTHCQQAHVEHGLQRKAINLFALLSAGRTAVGLRCSQFSVLINPIRSAAAFSIETDFSLIAVNRRAAILRHEKLLHLLILSAIVDQVTNTPFHLDIVGQVAGLAH
jgi:hypothetical protein